MKKYRIPTTYFTNSQYAMELSNELENDASGLIFDRFIHDLGAQLLIDIKYEKSIKDPNRWILGSNQDVELYLDVLNQSYYELTITPISEKGEMKIQQLQDNTNFLQ
ncbi:hypothetical protein [Bacillus sp. AK128]